jgi:hypothetical protein
VDIPNYELIDDEDEEVHAMVVALDVQRSYRRPRRLVPRECVDGEARMIHHYFAENPIYLPEQFHRRWSIWHHKVVCYHQHLGVVTYNFLLAGFVWIMTC